MRRPVDAPPAKQVQEQKLLQEIQEAESKRSSMHGPGKKMSMRELGEMVLNAKRGGMQAMKVVQDTSDVLEGKPGFSSNSNDSTTLAAALGQEQNRDTALRLLFYTVAMFTLPVLSFFVAEYFLNGYTKLGATDVLMFSGLASTATVVLVMVSFVMMAFSEDDVPPPGKGAAEKKVGAEKVDANKADAEKKED